MICAKPEKLEGNPRFSLLTQYERMAKIYQEIARSKEDPSEKAAYVDSARIILNEALELFGDDRKTEFDLTFSRGRFYQQNYNNIDDGLQKAYNDYAKLFELNPERAISLGDGYYLRQALNNIVRKGTKEEAQDFIDNVKPHADGEALAFIEEKQQEILGSPEEQIAYFTPLIEKNPENLDAWKALEAAYEDLDNREKLNEVKLKINELEPTYESAMDLAEFARSNADYQDAVKYYNQAMERTNDDSEKKDLYLRLADMHINLEELATAKGYVSDKVVYWLVIDYLNKAKQVDPSVANTVNRQMSSFQEVTPNSEDKFFTLNLENGQTISVDGSLNSCYSFINESTTVR
jgi:tetratricopeptide (TPR) repeat protein